MAKERERQREMCVGGRVSHDFGFLWKCCVVMLSETDFLLLNWSLVCVVLLIFDLYVYFSEENDVTTIKAVKGPILRPSLGFSRHEEPKKILQSLAHFRK